MGTFSRELPWSFLQCQEMQTCSWVFLKAVLNTPLQKSFSDWFSAWSIPRCWCDSSHTITFSVYTKFHRERALHLSCHCIHWRRRVGNANDVYKTQCHANQVQFHECHLQCHLKALETWLLNKQILRKTVVNVHLFANKVTRNICNKGWMRKWLQRGNWLPKKSRTLGPFILNSHEKWYHFYCCF